MELASAGRLLAACAVIGLVLLAVQACAKYTLSSPMGRRERGGMLAVLETAFLPGAASLHVVRVGRRYFVVGRSGAHIQALCEVPAEDVAPRARPARRPGVSLRALREVVARVRRPLG